MKEKLELLKKEALEKIEKCVNETEINQVKSVFFGKKSELSDLMKTFSNLEIEERKKVGMLINEFKEIVEEAFSKRIQVLKDKELEKKLENDKIDLSLPSKKMKCGSKHPITLITEEVEDLFVSMGYSVVDGSELESDYFNFELLNLPKGHPARDAQDTFYITEEMLLRTHTSPMQARTMQSKGGNKPIRIICPGKTFRRDDDASHSHQFSQIEGLVVDKNITLSDLKGTLELFAKKMFGDKVNIRFRASYFPFTEPSYEIDVSCFKCGGKGCSLCKNTGWIEILGSGMVHPNVLKMNGYDPEIYTGFAFGMGIERIAMLKYNIPDIRYFYVNDLRFLSEFNRRTE